MSNKDKSAQGSVPPFLSRLGLDQEADERAIRRAYARLLKQIDQETDLDGFQLLRQDYETALFWRSQREQVHEHEHEPEQARGEGEVEHTGGQALTEQPSNPGHPEPAPQVQEAPRSLEPSLQPAKNSEQSAHALMDELLHKLESGWPTEREAAQAWLHEVLEGDRLLDMDARFYFEGFFAGLLAHGWSPGKEHLFNSALSVFHWRSDRARLLAYGRGGIIVAEAIAELDFFESLSHNQRVQQRELIRRLRQDKRPSNSALLAQRNTLERILQIYPHWLHIISNTKNAERWQEWLTQIPKWRLWFVRKPPKRITQLSAGHSKLGWGWIALIVIMVPGLVRVILPSSPPPSVPVSTRPEMSYGSRPLSAPVSPPTNGHPVDLSMSYSEAIFQTIRPHIVIRERIAGNPAAEVTLKLMSDGRIASQELTKPSGNAVWDAAVMRAIRNVKSLPADKNGMRPTEMVLTFRPKA